MKNRKKGRYRAQRGNISSLFVRILYRMAIFMKKRIELAAVILVLFLYLISFFSNLTYAFPFATGWPKADFDRFITSALFLTAYILLILFYKNKMANYIMLALSGIPLRVFDSFVFTYLFNVLFNTVIGGYAFAFFFTVYVQPFYGLTFLLPTVRIESIPEGSEFINGDLFISVFCVIVLLLLLLKIIMFVRLNRKSKKIHD